MRFASPEFFKWLLLMVPLIAVIIFLHRRRAARLAELVSSKVWKTVVPGHSLKRIRRRTVLRLLAIFCIGLALTRPQWGYKMEEVQQRGLDILVVLDTSNSMLATDIRPNRLQQAQWAVRDFVRHLKGDRIGLIAFAGSSFLQCPVTVDYAAFTMMLNDLYAGIIPRGGTAIEQALETAMESFDTTTDADRVIILITDGEDHDGDPLKIAKKLRDENIRLYSIGVGTAEGELIPSQNGGYMKDEQGRVVKSTLNEALLEQLARETGGFYVRSAPGDFGLERIYELGIAKLQRGEQETRLARIYEERFGWLAAAALLFLLAEGLLRPKLVVLFLFFWLPNAEANEFPNIGTFNEGCELYRAKDFQGSEEIFADVAALAEDNDLKHRALYNRGTALLAGAFDGPISNRLEAVASAITLFEQSLELNPTDMDSKKNLEHALNWMVTGRIHQAEKLIGEADGLLEQFQAQAAKDNYQETIDVLEPVLDNFASDNETAAFLTHEAEQQLLMLEQTLQQVKDEMETAQQAIDSYRYKIAADILLKESPERRWAFDLDKELAEKFQQFKEKNQNVINIVYPSTQYTP
jgi:Ca-activated chloride channel family protein